MISDDPRSITCVKLVNPRRSFVKGSFRWIKRGGARILIGCPKGNWNSETKRCAVGTRSYKVYRFMSPGKKRCPTGYRKYR